MRRHMRFFRLSVFLALATGAGFLLTGCSDPQAELGRQASKRLAEEERQWQREQDAKFLHYLHEGTRENNRKICTSWEQTISDKQKFMRDNLPEGSVFRERSLKHLDRASFLVEQARQINEDPTKDKAWFSELNSTSPEFRSRLKSAQEECDRSLCVWLEANVEGSKAEIASSSASRDRKALAEEHLQKARELLARAGVAAGSGREFAQLYEDTRKELSIAQVICGP